MMKSRMRSISKRVRSLKSSRVASLISPAGKQVEQPGDRRLNDVDAGRFQRLDKPRRKADRDDVADPGLAADAGREADRARIARLLRHRGWRAGSRPLRPRSSAATRRHGRCRCGAGAECATAIRPCARSPGSAGSAARRVRTGRRWRGRTAATPTSGSNPASSSCSISSPRKPEQSTNRSPSMRVPLASRTAATSPFS